MVGTTHCVRLPPRILLVTAASSLRKLKGWRTADLVPMVDWRSVTRPETKKMVPRISLTSLGWSTHMAGATISPTLRLAPKHVRQCC